MAERKCQCGTSMTLIKGGVWLCAGHCDQPCPVPANRSCGTCLNYGAKITIRVLGEHQDERRGKRPGE